MLVNLIDTTVGKIEVTPQERRAVTRDEVKKLPCGIYHLTWKNGNGASWAAVGSLHNGMRWYAPINWTAREATGVASSDWRAVESVVNLGLAAPREDAP